MKLNPKEILFGTEDEKRGPVLLAVTPPRTGERTLLGVENLLQSIAVPEPFSLEIAGDMDGVTLMARCLDDQVVRGPARGPLPPGPHPEGGPRRRPPALGRGREGVVDHAEGGRPRVRAPQNLQGRRPARPRLRPPHSPHGRPLRAGGQGAGGGPADAALPGTRLVAGPHGQGPQAARHGAEGARLHIPDQAPADGRRDNGRTRPGGAGRPQGLPVGAGRRDMEGGAAGRRRGHRTGGGRLRMAPLEEGPEPRRRPHPDTGKGLPHRLRRRASGHGDTARRHPAPAGRGASRSVGRRLPPLRQPRRGAVQGGEGQAGPARPGEPAPDRPRPVRKTQRPGSPRGGRPVAPARSGGRDAPGGAVRRTGASALGEGRPGRSAGGRHHGGQAPAHPLPRRPAQEAPPLRRPHPHGQVHADAPHRHPQDEGEGRGQGRRRHRRRRPPRRPGVRAASAGPRVSHRPRAAHRPCRPEEGAGHQPAGHPHLLRPRPHRRLGGARRQGAVGAVGAEDAVDPGVHRQDPPRGQRAPHHGRGQPAHHPRRAQAPVRQEVPRRRAQEGRGPLSP